MTDEPSQAKLIWLTLPIALTVAVLLFSPNFRHVNNDSDALRSSPLGSDFLQEYAGGKVFASVDRDKLYELEHVRAVQHDSEVVGFVWPNEDYFPMVYPPFYYAATSAFSSLDYLTAVRLWLVLLGLALTGTGYLLLRFYPPIRESIGKVMITGLVFAPLLINFNMAQKGCLLLLILTATFVLLYQKRSFAAGLTFGVICFKPHLGLVIGIAMLLKRDWKFCSGAILTVAILAGGSWVLYPDLWSDYLGVVSGMSDYVQTGGYQLADSHSLWGATQLMLGEASPTIVKIVTGLLGLIVFGLSMRIVWPQVDYTSPEFGLQFAAMIVATVLLSPHFYTYDLTILLLAMLLTVSSFQPGWKQDKFSLILACGWVGFFVASGMFRQLAESTGFQLSVVVLIGFMIVLASKPVRAVRI